MPRDTTAVQYVDHTINFWRGCGQVDPGCRNCPAKFQSEANPTTMGRWGDELSGGTRVVAAERIWDECRTLDRLAEQEGERHRVTFQLGDPFEDWSGSIHNWMGEVLRFCGRCSVDRYFADKRCACGRLGEPLLMWHVRSRMFRTIDACPNLDWLLLTRFPENVGAQWPDCEDWDETMEDIPSGFRHNVWLGCSFSDQATADRRLPWLARYEGLCPILWGAAEPLLGPVSLPDQPIDWLVVGAEREGNRPCDIRWIMDLVDTADQRRMPAWVTRVGSEALLDGSLYMWRRDREFPKRVSPFGEAPYQWPAFIRRHELPTRELF